MKKVLFVATVTDHIIGFHIPYLKWFKEQGYEVHVASNGNSKIDYCDKHFDLPFERFPFKKENIKAYKELKKIIKENKYKIIHCHTPVGGVLARLSAKRERKNGTRVIYTAHGFHFYKGAPLLNWLIYYPIEKIMARYTDCLITINEEDYEFAKKHLKAKQIELVHGVGVDGEKFNIKMTEEEKQKLRQSLSINENDFVISYVAELNKNKNQIMLIKAVHEIIQKEKNIKVLLIGKGNNEEYLKKEIKKNNLEKNIFLLGYRKDIPRLLSITNLYVATSIREGLGLNVIEAISMEVLVLATNNRGHRSILDNKYLINKNEIKTLSKKIMEFYKMSEDEYKRLQKRQEINLNKFKLTSTINQMSKIYALYEGDLNEEPKDISYNGNI